MFESHITISPIDDAEFVVRCRNLGVKPVIIEQDSGSAELRQMMTAKFHFTADLDQAMTEMMEISACFDRVLRRKLEYIVRRNDPLPDHKYLEFHTKFEMDRDQVDNFASKVASLGGHTSHNRLKQPGDPLRCFGFATARSREVWLSVLSGLKEYRLVNTIMECVVYDDAPNIDIAWNPCIACEFKSYSTSELAYLLEHGKL